MRHIILSQLDELGREVMQTNKYINATKDNGSVFYGNVSDAEKNRIKVYVDSDHAGDLRTRKSRTGYIVMMNGGPISWTSRLQSLVALSSTEAEYYAITDAITDARILFKKITLK